jgi:hypothetical protein
LKTRWSRSHYGLDIGGTPNPHLRPRCCLFPARDVPSCAGFFLPSAGNTPPNYSASPFFQDRCRFPLLYRQCTRGAIEGCHFPGGSSCSLTHKRSSPTTLAAEPPSGLFTLSSSRNRRNRNRHTDSRTRSPSHSQVPTGRRNRSRNRNKATPSRRARRAGNREGRTDPP